MVMQNNNKHFIHLNQEKRIEIYKFLELWYSYRKIWSLINKHHTTISREINRNSIDYGRWKTKYKPLEAQKKNINRRHKADKSRIILSKNHKLRSIIFHILSSDKYYRWPDEIIWYLKIHWFKTVCTSTLYNYIRNYTNRSKYLRFKYDWYKYARRKRKKSITIKNVPKIDKRESQANNRERIWDREIDTIVSKWHIWWLFTSVDRKSRILFMNKIPNHKSSTLLTIITHTMQNLKIHTITSDNWSEFAKLSTVWKRLNAKCYTAHPYSSYERWTNERTNWLIRRFIPKWSDISIYSDQEIINIQNILNHKPRKSLNYKTPYEVYYNVNIQYLSYSGHIY